MDVVWKELGVDFARLHGGKPVRDESSDRIGIDYSQVFDDYRPSNLVVTREIALTESLREEPNPMSLGYDMGALFSDQSYRWN